MTEGVLEGTPAHDPTEGGGALHLIVPGPIEQRTGGYLYDSRMVSGLRKLDWTVTVRGLDGAFPRPDARARAALPAALATVPDGARVLVDGLAFAAAPAALFAQADRLRIVGLVHHLISDEFNSKSSYYKRLRTCDLEALAACRGTIVTSEFTARRLSDLGMDSDRIRVVVPGTVPARSASGPPPGEPPRLLCVGSLIPRKGQDVLVRALAGMKDTAWECVVAGSLERDVEFAGRVRQLVHDAGLSERVVFVGECDQEALERLYDESSVFVLPSRHEGYGMALAEALAHGLPIVSTKAGAIPETVPEDAGLLVSPDDESALAEALGVMLADGTAERCAAAARRGAVSLPGWDQAVQRFAQALAELAPEPAPSTRLGMAEPTESGRDTRGRRVTAPGSSFGAGWLALREPLDHRARADILLPFLRERWRRDDWSRVLDLGSGTGSNLRYLAPRLPGPQHWTLVDSDAALLDRAEPVETLPTGRTRPGLLTLERVAGDLAHEGLSLVSGAHLVTASALLDLTSESWLRRLVTECRASSCGVLLTLTYDGRISWSPGPGEAADGGEEDADDERVEATVNAHQRRDKGLGPALGPEATRVAEHLFRAADYQTWIAPSPWRMDGADRELAEALVDGWERAALEQRPGASDRIRAWAARRRRAARKGSFLLEVGHLDLLALPLESGSA